MTDESEIVIHGVCVWPPLPPAPYSYEDAVYAALAVRDRSPKWIWEYLQGRLTDEHDRNVVLTFLDTVSFFSSFAEKEGNTKWPTEPETSDKFFPY